MCTYFRIECIVLLGIPNYTLANDIHSRCNNTRLLYISINCNFILKLEHDKYMFFIPLIKLLG